MRGKLSFQTSRDSDSLSLPLLATYAGGAAPRLPPPNAIPKPGEVNLDRAAAAGCTSLRPRPPNRLHHPLQRPRGDLDARNATDRISHRDDSRQRRGAIPPQESSDDNGWAADKVLCSLGRGRYAVCFCRFCCCCRCFCRRCRRRRCCQPWFCRCRCCRRRSSRRFHLGFRDAHARRGVQRLAQAQSERLLGVKGDAHLVLLDKAVVLVLLLLLPLALHLVLLLPLLSLPLLLLSRLSRDAAAAAAAAAAANRA